MVEANKDPNTDRIRSELEVHRLEAEQEICQLTRDKLFEELRELRRPWYARPGAVPAYATLLVAMVGGFLAFGTDLLKSNILSLKRSNDEQAVEQQKLKDQVVGLVKTRDNLNYQIGAMKKELETRTTEVEMTSFRGLIDLLRTDQPIDSASVDKLINAFAQNPQNRLMYVSLLRDVAKSS